MEAGIDNVRYREVAADPQSPSLERQVAVARLEELQHSGVGAVTPDLTLIARLGQLRSPALGLRATAERIPFTARLSVPLLAVSQATPKDN